MIGVRTIPNGIFEHRFDGICVIGKNGLITDVNREFEEITGYCESALLNVHFSEAALFKNDEILSCIKTGLNGETLHSSETTLLHYNGHTIYVVCKATPIAVQSQVTAVYLNIKDFTKQRETETTLRKTQRILAQIQRIARVGSWEYDPSTKESHWSAELFDIYGIENTGSISLSTVVQYIHPDDKDHFLSSVKSMVGGAPYDLEFRIIRPDNEVRILHSKRAMFVDEYGDTRMVGTLQDITDLKRTQELLLKSEKLAIVGQLAAGVAHEIRNPLTSLKGFLKLIPTAENPQRYLDIMDGELSRIEAVTNELLVLARPQMRQLSIINISHVLHNVVELLQAQANLKGVDLVMEMAGNIPLIECEVGQIEQVFINVIKNAIEAAPLGGKVTVELGHTDNNAALLRVIDNGPGVTQDEMMRLGVPFYTTKDGGTGLGLMVSNRIVLDHDGSLQLESTPGVGTIVSIVLPHRQDVRC